MIIRSDQWRPSSGFALEVNSMLSRWLITSQNRWLDDDHDNDDDDNDDDNDDDDDGDGDGGDLMMILIIQYGRSSTIVI